jgi:Tfp pilus assembly protein PilW
MVSNLRNKRSRALTLAEMLVALMVTGIILTAVVTLADAMATANEIALDLSEEQARARYALLRISNLIRHGRLICAQHADTVTIWRADDNDDKQINVNELVYVDKGAGSAYLRICDFSGGDSSSVPISGVGSLSSQWWLPYGAEAKYTMIIPQCNYVQFTPNTPPPYTSKITVYFDLYESGIFQQYETEVALRCRAANLLNGSGEIVSDDD